jgi:hypothetical protein
LAVVRFIIGFAIAGEDWLARASNKPQILESQEASRAGDATGWVPTDAKVEDQPSQVDSRNTIEQLRGQIVSLEFRPQFS